jgi:chromodomain-helicase-DNA-binding protein 7
MQDVETLPEKEEVVIWVELTAQQRAYYRAIYGKQIGTLLGGVQRKNLPGLRNLAMELRKVRAWPCVQASRGQDDVVSCLQLP